mmetsp:Transcript_10889/g.13673  ORF Transcript_10889/g.13673 Transcript_10889/m.13673 type:complete len:263 (+) Transcript_10889:39-827(+)
MHNELDINIPTVDQDPKPNQQYWVSTYNYSIHSSGYSNISQISSVTAAMEAEQDANAPLCTVCSHHHNQGEKCPICGHKGKGKIYQRLIEGPASQGLHYEYFDTRTDENSYKGNWTFCKIIRRRVFCEEGGIPEHIEFDEYDPPSRHAIALIGDAPVGCGRWRVEAADQGHIAFLDRLCILPSHRAQGIGRAFVQHILTDVSAVANELGVAIVALIAAVPLNSSLQQKLVENSFVPAGEAFEDRGQNFIRMFLSSSPGQTSS